MPPNLSPHLVEPGQRYGRLTVINFSHQDKRWRRHYLVRCACGAEKSIQGSLLRSGNTRSCGCLAKEAGAKRRISRHHSDTTAVILGYKRHAQDRGFEWKLTREQVAWIISKDCHYCGSPPANTKTTKNTLTPLKYSGLDRADNTKGYSVENVVPCCRICNRAKQTLTVAEFATWAKAIGAMAAQWSGLHQEAAA